ncbi:MAG: endonuclease/exonuclease/phosphatase family protein [Bacteroidetes bacterium]|nr:endonuclease/exonuclease/phosphatase family protein [Bacteroidota bacterium]
MNRTIFLFVILISSIKLLAQFEDLTFGTDSTLEVVTWNIEHFPKNGQPTVNYVREIIEALDVDILAIQEVEDFNKFNELVEDLDGWDGSYAYNPYAALAYIYKTYVIKNVNIFEIYTDRSREFPRSPYVMEMDYMNTHYIIINNHYKCCGDGYLDMNDDWDEEKRRWDASILFDQYIVDNYPNENVIIVGDLNDLIAEPSPNNVFQVFIDNPDSYNFVDMSIAEGSNYNWSYPSWPSHIDHILITNELFDDFSSEVSVVETIRLDDYFEGGFYVYDENVSDHRPVGLKLPMPFPAGIDSQISYDMELSNYPNPFYESTTFTFPPVSDNSILQINNIDGTMVSLINLEKSSTSTKLSASNLKSGIYFVKLIVEGRTVDVKKIVVAK